MKMTLEQRYYAINTAINNYLTLKNISARVIKYGVDPGTISGDDKNTKAVKYPYMQSSYRVAVEQPWTNETTGVFTDFDYQLSYFAGPRSEKINDQKYFYPWNVVKNVMGNVQENILGTIASIRSKEGPYEFSIKSGQPVPTAVMIYKMRAVCAYEAIIPSPGVTTDIDQAITIVGE